MTDDLFPRVFEDFRAAATVWGVYPHIHKKADTLYRQRFHDWRDAISVTQVDLPAKDAAGFDRSWIFVPKSRPGNSHRARTEMSVLTVAISHATGKLAVVTSQTNLADLQKLRENPGKLAGILATLDRGERVAYSNLQADYGYIARFLSAEFKTAARQLSDRLDLLSVTMKLLPKNRRHLKRLATEHAEKALTALAAPAHSDIDGAVDFDCMDFTKHILAQHGLKGTRIGIYNHIVAGVTPQARMARRNAVTMFAPLRDLFFKRDEIWQAIDGGHSPIRALAENFGVSPGTLRHMLTKPDLFGLGDQVPELARYLDRLNIQRWPQSKTDLIYFEIIMKAARQYGEAFSRDPRDILKAWAKQYGSRARWKHIAVRLLKPQIKRAYADSKTPKKKYLSMRSLLNMRKFWERVLALQQTEYTNITHMKNDMATRLLRPALLLAFEARGWHIAQATLLTEMEKTLAENLWKDASPSEQIAASAYWHSPRVNFQLRFNSLSRAEGLSWYGAIPKPLTLKNGVVAHPLDSSAALREEADAMHHCVWSYSDNCMSRNYHIFSLRTEDGQRLSTLTVKDYFEEDARLVKRVEHKAKANKEPPESAKTAEKLLIEMINNEETPLQWDKVDECRAEYTVKAIDNAVGYDFRDAQTRDNIFELYAPCQPRRIMRESRGTFEGYAQALGADALVDRFLSRHDFRLGGLVAANRNELAALPLRANGPA